MVFSSQIFLFAFLPLFLAIYYLCPPRGRNLVVLIGSYAFYAWWRVDFLLLFMAVTGWNYLIGLRIADAGVRSEAARRWCVLGVVVNLGVLAYFKYANFGVDAFNVMMTQVGLQPFELTRVILPIGISFYIFQAISYVVDVYRGDADAAREPVKFAAFIALFPQLIAGPVLRYKDLAHQFESRTHSLDQFSEGATRFMQGFIKKVFIADSIAPLVDEGFALEDPSPADAWIAVIAYTVQLYFDFSGYSDMAIGLGLMMGFRFIENFNQPYISQSITEFWRRWHISLSTWLRDYLYIPLGGNRHGTFKTYRNLLLTMLLGGFWHGANWTFLIWGAWHGGWLALERALGLDTRGKGFAVHRWAFTLLLVMLGWVVFRAADVGEAMRLYSAMFSTEAWAISPVFAAEVTGMRITLLLVGIAVLIFTGVRSRLPGRPTAPTPLPSQAPVAAVSLPAVMLLLLLPLFALSVLKLAAQDYSPFLYFQF